MGSRWLSPANQVEGSRFGLSSAARMPEDAPQQKKKKKRFLSPVTTNGAYKQNPPSHLGLLTGWQSPSHTLVFRTRIPTPSCSRGKAPPLCSPVSRLLEPAGSDTLDGIYPFLGQGCASGLRGLPAALQLSVRCARVATPSPDSMSRSQDDSPRALPTSVAATVGEDGREAEKGTGKLRIPLALRSHFSFPFRICLPLPLTGCRLKSPRGLRGFAQPLLPPASSTFVKAVEILPLVTKRRPHAHRPRLGSFQFTTLPQPTFPLHLHICRHYHYS